MRTIVKILLSIVILFIWFFINIMLTQAGTSPRGIIRLIIMGIMVVGIISVWRYKPKTSESKDLSNTDLDKKL